MTPAESSLFHWQTLESLAGLLELTLPEVLSRLGKEVERLNRGGETVYRLRTKELASRQPTRLSGDAVKTLFADAVSDFRRRRKAGKIDFLQKRDSGDKAPDDAGRKQRSARQFQPWARFPCWFEPAFCTDEDSVA